MLTTDSRNLNKADYPEMNTFLGCIDWEHEFRNLNAEQMWGKLYDYNNEATCMFVL